MPGESPPEVSTPIFVTFLAIILIKELIKKKDSPGMASNHKFKGNFFEAVKLSFCFD